MKSRAGVGADADQIAGMVDSLAPVLARVRQHRGERRQVRVDIGQDGDADAVHGVLHSCDLSACCARYARIARSVYGSTGKRSASSTGTQT